MSPQVRVIRFARPEPAPPNAAHGTILVARVFLDEHPAPVGAIVRCGPEWRYVLGGADSAAIATAVSRQDLEYEVELFHLGGLPDAVTAETVGPLPLAV